MVTMESLYETTVALSNGRLPLLTPYDLLFPQNGVPAMSPFAKLLWRLLFIM